MCTSSCLYKKFKRCTQDNDFNKFKYLVILVVLRLGSIRRRLVQLVELRHSSIMLGLAQFDSGQSVNMVPHGRGSVGFGHGLVGVDLVQSGTRMVQSKSGMV